MKISFVGAGKVGTTLGLFFKENGYHVEGYYSRTFESAKKASELTNTKAYNDLELLVSNSDMIWITTNDDQIERVANQLSKLKNIHEGQIIVHASGAHSSEILNTLKQRGCIVFSVHPLQAFSDTKTALKALKDTTFTIEGDNKKINIITEILDKTNNPYFTIDTSGKALYHAAACILSNYLVTLIDAAYNLFEKSGIERSKIYNATLPLIMGTLGNIKSKDRVEALTGPIKRGDESTIKKHIEAIGRNSPLQEDIYRFMGLKTIEMLEKNNKIQNNDIQKIKEILRRNENE